MNDITLEGVDSLVERLERIGDTDALKMAMGKACAIVERSAKQKAPKGRGGEAGLRGSIKSKVEDNGGDIDGVIYTALEYAPYVEFGTGLFAEKGGRKDVPWVYRDDEGEFHTTSGMHPQPFLRPALHENREKILQLLREAITND